MIILHFMKRHFPLMGVYDPAYIQGLNGIQKFKCWTL